VSTNESSPIVVAPQITVTQLGPTAAPQSPYRGTADRPDFVIARRWSPESRNRRLTTTILLLVPLWLFMLWGAIASDDSWGIFWTTLCVLPMTYPGLRWYANVTRIDVRGDVLRVDVTPLRWFGDRRTLSVHELGVVFAEAKHPWYLDYPVHRVVARLADGSFVPLVRGLRRREDAEVIAQSLDHRLGLVASPPVVL
jgi:hypothetical protein